MNNRTRALCVGYALGIVLNAIYSGISINAGATWAPLGLGFITSLLLVALGREYIAADERRAAAVRAERAARLRARAEQRDLRAAADALGHACCALWWTSCGTRHDSTCTSQRRTA